jgi:hypothetical protein
MSVINRFQTGEKMETAQIDCTNFANKVIEREDVDDETKIKLLQLIKDFEVQYKSFNWNLL